VSPIIRSLVRKAYSKRRRLRLWSELVNLRTWGLVTDSIVIVQAFAELRYGLAYSTCLCGYGRRSAVPPQPALRNRAFRVVHTRENSVKYGGTNYRQTLRVNDHQFLSKHSTPLQRMQLYTRVHVFNTLLLRCQLALKLSAGRCALWHDYHHLR
jgi:hypothetical protein